MYLQRYQYSIYYSSQSLNNEFNNINMTGIYHLISYRDVCHSHDLNVDTYLCSHLAASNIQTFKDWSFTGKSGTVR